MRYFEAYDNAMAHSTILLSCDRESVPIRRSRRVIIGEHRIVECDFVESSFAKFV
jgi:hypothetical protein